MEFTQGSLIHNTYEEHTEILNAICAEWTGEAALLLHSQIKVSQAEVRKITLDQIQMARQQTALFKCPDSGHPLPVQSTPSVQTLDGLIPARVQQASRAGRFANTAENNQLHSLMHINVLWLVTHIKQA